MSAAELVCWELAARLTTSLVTAGAPAALALLLLARSTAMDSAPDCIRWLERQALVTVAVVALAWMPWYQVRAGQDTLQMPPAWHLMFSLTGAINDGVRNSLPADDELAARVMALTGADLQQQPELLDEYGQFESECYLPARRKAAALGLDERSTSWAGARTLLETPGLYLRCGDDPGPACANGFFAPEQGLDANRPTGSCRSWWLGRTAATGLRERMLQGLKADSKQWWDGDLSSEDGDAWLQAWLLRSGGTISGLSVVASASGILSGVGRIWERAKQWLGAAAQPVGSAALAWQVGVRGILWLQLAPGILQQLQVVLLALIGLLWPAIALLSGLSLQGWVGTARLWLAVQLWTALGAVGEVLHLLLWRRTGESDEGLAAAGFQTIRPVAVAAVVSGGLAALAGSAGRKLDAVAAVRALDRPHRGRIMFRATILTIAQGRQEPTDGWKNAEQGGTGERGCVGDRCRLCPIAGRRGGHCGGDRHPERQGCRTGGGAGAGRPRSPVPGARRSAGSRLGSGGAAHHGALWPTGCPDQQRRNRQRRAIARLQPGEVARTVCRQCGRGVPRHPILPAAPGRR